MSRVLCGSLQVLVSRQACGGNTHLDKNSLRSGLDKHRSEPNVPIDAYVRARRIELGKGVTGRRLIYLDKRYWIILRDVVLKRRADPASVHLLEMLRTRVLNQHIICPISQSTFVELLKQADLRTRRETAVLIDELSLGVTLAPEEERIGTELAHFIHTHSGETGIYPLKWLVWSKLSYVFGVAHRTHTAFEPAEELVAQKAFFDHMWDRSLTEIIETLGHMEPPLFNYNGLALRLNAGIAAHSNAIHTFDQAYMHEIEGALSVYMPVARSVLESMFKRATGMGPGTTEEEQMGHERQLLALLVQALTRAEVRKQLPTLHVHALCHAAVRWDKKRRFEGNDLHDFHHAAAAVPYCDAFFTEKSLRSLLQSNHLKIRQDFACRVISSESEAAECAETI